ncbi:MAG: tryptophan-rich sensory protein [Clostridium sp.]|nr:tryptophan-rich sensory protein [Clostridium sp.]
MKNIFLVEGKIKKIPLILFSLLPLVGAFIVSLITKDSMNVYSEIEKPFFAPPPIVFIIVWVILYLLMGISSYRIYMMKDKRKDTGTALFFYIIQLLLNYLWSFLFFSFRLYGLALIELIILLIFIIITFIKFIKIDKIAGYLLIPYILWCTFALILNFFIWDKNER